MKLKNYYHVALYIFLSITKLGYADTINIPKSKLDMLKLDFKKISPAISKIGQAKVPNPFGKDLDAIYQALNSRELTDKDIESILAKLRKIKTSLLGMDENTKVSIQVAPGRNEEKLLSNFLAVTYNKFVSDLKLILQSSKKINDAINTNDLKLIRESFKPIFWGFYDLFEHAYYKYLEIVRRALHGDLNKESLILIRDTINLLLLDLDDENQNQTMILETSAYQKFNLTIKDFKELIKKYLNNVNALIK